MKREFLQNFKVGEAALPKEIIDAIMAENGRDIEAAKAPFADYDTLKGQLTEAQNTLKEIKENGQTIEAAQAKATEWETKATEWETKYNESIENHKAEMADRDFTDRLTAAITGAKGKNSKAITALLDVDALKASKNQESDIKAALEACQKDNGYLFGEEKNPSGFAGGAGGGNGSSDGVSGVEAAFRSMNPGMKFD